MTNFPENFMALSFMAGPVEFFNFFQFSKLTKEKLLWKFVEIRVIVVKSSKKN